MTFDLIQQEGSLLFGKPSPWHHQCRPPLSPDSLSNPASPNAETVSFPGLGVLENRGSAARPPKPRHRALPVPQFPQQLLSVPQSKAPWGSGPGPGHLPLPFGPCWIPIPPEEGRAGGDRQMDSDRLRQNSLHWQAEGGQSSSSHGGGWGPQGPPRWLRILAKPPHQRRGGCSCLNPVPRERHLLVIGTMETAAGFWTWLRAASFRGRTRGSSRTADSAWGGRVVCAATPALPFSACSHAHRASDWPSQKCSQSRWERKGLRG